jgi:mono/diheme cytochrome c family protein
MNRTFSQLALMLSLTGAVGAAIGSEAGAADGKELYEMVGCWACHGFSGQGANARGIASGPRIQARLLPRENFFALLRRPAGSMPPYTGQVLSDAQVEEIYNYLKTIPEPRSLASIPELKQAETR